MDNSFLCVNAVDSWRELHYELDRIAHRQRSLERARGDDAERGSGDP